jgi:hypothetical protein
LKGNKTKRFKDKNKKLQEEGPNKKYQKTKKTNQQFSREDRERKRKKKDPLTINHPLVDNTCHAS